jgi:hypothetical protein
MPLLDDLNPIPRRRTARSATSARASSTPPWPPGVRIGRDPAQGTPCASPIPRWPGRVPARKISPGNWRPWPVGQHPGGGHGHGGHQFPARPGTKTAMVEAQRPPN